MVRFQNARYYLHPLDREYARAQLAVGQPGDSLTAFTLTGLQARAADYYVQIRTPRRDWHSLEDVRPPLAGFELRCDTGNHDTAATVLRNLDNYLEKWGHYRTLVGLHGRIHGRIATPTMNASHLSNLGLCHHSLGEYRRAIDLYTEALAIARETGYRQSESARLGNLGLCYYNLGEYQRAIDLCTQALAIAREIGYRQVEANALGNIGRAWLASGDANQAAAMLAQAVSIADTIGAVEPALEARSWLAWAHLQLEMQRRRSP
jgi:tetratricopeptide (TPR) repeat protein